MKRTERVVIYSALIALAAVNAVFLLSSTGQAALGEARAYLDSLGPAESIKLMDEDKEMALRNKKGRLAWGDGDFRQTYSVAFVDISRALNPLMDSETYKEEREALAKELEATENDYKAKLDAYGEQLQKLDRETPEAKEKLDEARKLFKEYQDWGVQAMGRKNALDVQHLQKAYKELTNAVDVVADKLNVDIVLRFIPTEKEFKATDAEQALAEIRLRTAVKYPGALDITTEVLQEMSLQDKEG
jgi:Skp family chaperone for outer membrane proteins